MRYRKNKILNIFLLAVMLMAFGGGELFTITEVLSRTALINGSLRTRTATTITSL